MCTAATYRTECFYMGRNLDYDEEYGAEVTITQRRYPFTFRHGGTCGLHYAMIGTALVREGYPLYYDAVNEKGLGMAGLNFVSSTCYHEPEAGKRNIAQFELIPYVLGQCSCLSEARKMLSEINITGEPFADGMPAARLHWLIADRTGAMVVESVAEGVKLYDDPVGVLTNEPPFPVQLFSLNDYMGLSPRQPENRFSDRLGLTAYSRGMGTNGLPGGLSSRERFVRAAFTRLNSVSGRTESESVGQFFHILASVEQVRGCCVTSDSKCEVTQYTSCWNADRGIYYYTTYTNRQICAVDMHRESLGGSGLVCYPMLSSERIHYQNKKDGAKT